MVCQLEGCSGAAGSWAGDGSARAGLTESRRDLLEERAPERDEERGLEREALPARLSEPEGADAAGLRVRGRDRDLARAAAWSAPVMPPVLNRTTRTGEPVPALHTRP